MGKGESWGMVHGTEGGEDEKLGEESDITFQSYPATLTTFMMFDRRLLDRSFLVRT